MSAGGGARRTFAPVVLVGLGAGAVGAVAASQNWFRGTGDAGGLSVTQSVKGSDAAPLALALMLVVLASWGVILVTRQLARRLALGVGLLAALGVLVTVVVVAPDAPDIVARALQDRGAVEVVGLHRTAWFVITGLAAAIEVVGFAVGMRFVAQWPTMASRYDAPGSAARTTTVEEPTGDRDLWTALDEGRDPTDRPAP